MAQVPTSVRIGALAYTIVKQEPPILLQDKVCYGLHDWDLQQILLAADMPFTQLQQTLMHEILHAIHADRSFTPGEVEGEVICNEFGHGFYHFVKTNSEVVKFLTKKYEEDQSSLPVSETIPNSIAVGVYQYKLQSKSPILRNGLSIVGDIDFYQKLIWYKPDRGPDVTKLTLMHYIIQAIFDYRNFNFSSSTDTELIVEELALGLLLFVKQNPQFLSWIMGGCT